MVALVRSSPNKKATSSDSASSGNVRVVARIRPVSQSEVERGTKETVTSLEQPTIGGTKASALVQVQTDEKRWFELDAVFGKDSTQAGVYRQSGAQEAVCEDLFKGFNCTILAYGQTGSGKTFTMGTASTNGAEICETDGIIPRACADLFEAIQQKCDGNAKVELSYLELYNEEIRDLFAPHGKAASALKIRETMAGEVYVSGLVSKQVNSPREIGMLMEEASKRRVVASTAMNAVSSRSHAICTLRVQGVLEGPDGTTDRFESKLTLVDLAGSERIKKTGAQGTRQAEGISINKSLLVLGQVVSALSSEQGKRQRQPPYRDSKLTRLLKDSLGGNSRTIIVACISPADYNVEESVNTLRYATSARNIKNKATRNMVQNTSPEEAAKLQRENQLLKRQVAELQEMLEKRQDVSSSSSASSPSRDASMERTRSTCSHLSVDSSENELDSRSTDGPPIPQQIAMEENSHESNMENTSKQVEQLKKQLQAAREEAQKAVEVPALHWEISRFKEQIAEMKEIAQENVELQRELAEARQDAESARTAAIYLSDIVDSLKEIKRDEIDRKIQNLQQTEKEQHWIAFVSGMLVNYRRQMSQLTNDFSTRVVQAINNLEFTEDQDALLRKAVERKQHKQTRRSSWWSGGKEESEESVVLPWEQSTAFFMNRLREVEDTIHSDTDSLWSVHQSLAEECRSLEEEIGVERLASEWITTTDKDQDLVEQLTSLLLGPQTVLASEARETINEVAGKRNTEVAQDEISNTTAEPLEKEVREERSAPSIPVA